VIPQPRTIKAGARTVGFYEYGDPAGAPVMVFHGTPACGAGFGWADEPARERGLRLVAPDRPGVGLSSRDADGWTVGAYPPMVAEVADALGIDTYAVWGYSGGGPYAVACAAAPAGRVTRAAVAAGMGEVGAWATEDDFEKTDRQMLQLARKRPRMAKLVMAVSVRLARMAPKQALKSFDKQLSESDRKVLADLGPPDEAMALFTQSVLKGATGVVHDYLALGRAWGVDYAAVTVPVRIFQGDADTMVPPRHADGLHERIPAADVVRWPGEGHLGTVTHAPEILDWLAG
jgi:pimeloyl-ACP methyl ester carboxylesterase